MDPLDLVFRAGGLFYVFAGYVLLRAILMDAFLDKALSALTLDKMDARESGRRKVLGAMAVCVGASGAALALLSFWALPLFAFTLAAQVLWIGWARALFVTPEDDEPQSRRGNVNAAILYAVATVGVAALWQAGRLGPWDDPVVAAAIAATAAGLAFWFVYRMSWKPGFATAGPDMGWGEPPEDIERIVIDPARWCWPLVNADTEGRFNHLSVLDEELGSRVEHWDDIFQNAFDPEDEMGAAAFASAGELAGYLAEGEAIAKELGAIYGVDNVVFGARWDDLKRREA